jgi:ankyrin repeat protein
MNDNRVDRSVEFRDDYSHIFDDCKNGSMAVMAASIAGHLPVVETLLNYGASVKEKNMVGIKISMKLYA